MCSPCAWHGTSYSLPLPTLLSSIWWLRAWFPQASGALWTLAQTLHVARNSCPLDGLLEGSGVSPVEAKVIRRLATAAIQQGAASSGHEGAE